MPHSKTPEGYTEDFVGEYNWKEATNIGQPYLYVAAKYKTPEGEQVLKLNSQKDRDYGNYYLPKDITLYNEPKQEIIEEKAEDEATVTKVEPEFKKGDKVKMISEKPSFGFGGVKTGDIGIIESANKRGTIYVTFPNHSYWSARIQDIELVVENEIESEFKTGDYVCFEMYGKYSICKINRIDGNKLWGEWTSCKLKTLPKTISEFDEIEKNSGNGFISSNDSSLKKLVLVDDTKPEIKVGDMVTRKQAIKIIKNGGEIKAYGFIYFEECGILKFKNGERIAENSSGYEVNLGGKLEVISLLKEAIDKSQAEKMVREGKEIIVNNIFKYFLEDGVLVFMNNKTGRLHESLGFKEAFKEGFTYSLNANN